MEPDKELKPRTTTELDAPGSDELLDICTPAIFPDKADITSELRVAVILSLFTEVAEYPNAFSERLIPIAVTTTSSSTSVSDFNTTLKLGLIATSCACIPTNETCKVFAELSDA